MPYFQLMYANYELTAVPQTRARSYRKQIDYSRYGEHNPPGYRV